MPRTRTRYVLIGTREYMKEPEEEILNRPQTFVMYKSVADIMRYNKPLLPGDRIFKISSYVSEIKIKE